MKTSTCQKCERDLPADKLHRKGDGLQGFKDNYTAIPVRGKPAADGPRYKSLGNSMVVPVMAWIGRRIAEVDAITASERTAA